MDNTFVIRSASVSDRGLSEKRPQNEDSYLEIDQIGIFAVADGVGGANAGEVASQMAVEILGEAFTNFPEGSDVEHVMKAALEQANSAIHQMSNDLSQLSKMATTVVALHVNGNIATIGHVGDSRLYRLDPEGTLFRETDDHSMVAEEVRAGRMTEEQAENHPSKNIISRALGAEPTVEVDLKTIMVEPNTRFLLCSDGVTRHIGDIELAELLSSNEDAETICRQIKTICFQRGAEDNLTAVIVEVGAAKAAADVTSADVTAAVAEPAVVAENDDVLSLPDDEEMTVATARFPKLDAEGLNADDDDLLELETKQLEMPIGADRHFENETVTAQSEHAEHETYDDPSLHETVPFTASETAEVELPLYQPEEPVNQAEAAPVYEEPSTSAVVEEDRFSMFGEDTYGTVADRAERPLPIGKIAAYFGMLIAGTLLGLGVYHFFLKPPPALDAPPITEMKSANPQVSNFEDLRRETDKDPTGYLAKTPAPEDAEDYYLQGRAYFLSGDYAKARTAFAETKALMAKGDPATKGDEKNAKVILSDIAVAMAVINNPLAQQNLKSELETLKSATPIR